MTFLSLSFRVTLTKQKESQTGSSASLHSNTSTQICWRVEPPPSSRDLMRNNWDPALALSMGKLLSRRTSFKEGRARWSPTEANTTLGKYLTFRATLIRHQEEIKAFIPIKILLYLL